MFNIKSVKDKRELTMLGEFLLGQSQFYPNYGLWVAEKCIPRIESGEYQNIVVLSDGNVIGEVVYRELDDSTTEIKNFRIDSQYRRRALGNLLMSQIEFLNPGKNLRADITVNNFLGVEFFVRNGFHIIGLEDLYVRGQGEYIIEKPSRTPKTLVSP